MHSLADDGKEVIYTYRSEPLKNTKAIGLKLDLTSTSDLTRHTADLKNVTHLVHAAAMVKHNREDILQDLYDQLVSPTEAFRQLIKRLPNLRRVVYVSSCSAALASADPTFYGPGKLLMEGVVRRVAAAQGIPYVNMRFPQLFGPGEPHGIFVTKFMEALQGNEEIQLVNEGSVKKDILYIDDAVGSIRQALVDSINSGEYTITMPRATTIREVLDTLQKAMAVKATIQNITVPDEEARSKSFHFPSTSAAMGYKVRYNVRQGIDALVKGTEKRNHV